MIILGTTTDNLQIVLDVAIATNQLQCISDWRDKTSSTFTPGRTVTNTNNTTDVDLVPAPGASTERIVSSISIINTDTKNACVIIKFDANGTEYIVTKVTLAPQERLEYGDMGRKVFTDLGAEKVIINEYIGVDATNGHTVVLRNDFVNNDSVANTLKKVPGMGVVLKQRKRYWVQATLIFETAINTTGISYYFSTQFIGRQSPTAFSNGLTRSTIRAITPLSTVAESISIFGLSFGVSVTASSVSGKNVVDIIGYLETGTNTELDLYISSEVASSAVKIKAGSLLFIKEV